MLDMTFTDVVTIRRQKAGTMGVHGRPEYETVEIADEPVRVRCLIAEPRQRVAATLQGQEIEVDAVLKFRPRGAVTIREQDIVVDEKTGQAYEVLGLNSQGRLGFGSIVYASADLKKTRIEVPES